jgi:hypothetical protein
MFNLDELENAYIPTSTLNFLKYDLRRLQRSENGQRFYYLFGDTEERLFLNCTGFCDAALPANPYLIAWRIKQATELTQEIAAIEFRLTAVYGTIYHILLSYVVHKIGENPKNWKINNLDTLCRDISESYLVQNYPDISLKLFLSKYLHVLNKDVTCFCQFAIDCKLRVIASEFRVVDFENLIAGTLDLAAEITTKKGRSNYIIDFKSGKKGFFEKHRLQLAFLMHAWNKLSLNRKDMPEIQNIANFAPVDYKKMDTPTYKFEDQTKSQEVEALPDHLKLVKIYDLVKSKTPNGIFWQNGEPCHAKLINDFYFENNEPQNISFI